MGEIILFLMATQAQILSELDKLNKESFTKDDVLKAMDSTTTVVLKTLASKKLEEPEEKSAEDLINEGLDNAEDLIIEGLNKLNSNKNK